MCAVTVTSTVNVLVERLCTFLQLSRPKRRFWEARRGTYLHFVIIYEELVSWPAQAYFWTSTSQVYLVGLIQLTILSGQGHFSELVVQTGEILFHCD